MTATKTVPIEVDIWTYQDTREPPNLIFQGIQNPYNDALWQTEESMCPTSAILNILKSY